MAWEHIPPDVFNQICLQMDKMECNGEFDKMFKQDFIPVKGTNKKSFLGTFAVGMKLFKSTFLKILSYDIDSPGFAQDAIVRLNILGCSKAEEYYSLVKLEYEHEYEAEMKRVSQWYHKHCIDEFERRKVNWSRKQQEAELLARKKELLLMKKLKLLTQH